ncbi:uncharacterized protein LOC132725260 isoform X3 [Ruditapes philippinarum]|uniref:uncharacterized protein LOC132725260 isoform X3 n=1 Tax=Ruditapes philippinarum TaxID=129788 RepID=UPI00295C379E|nr:uncharacterized protein LOC132725260 isoform X3 [Ruditapes philippinarum]
MLVFVGIGLCASSLLINIIGLAIPYWVYASAGDVKQYSGLWSSCGSVGGNSVCVDIPDAFLDGAFKATRAMEILGMILILAALVCVLLKQFVIKDQALLPKIGACLAIVAGIFMIIGTIIYATRDGLDSSNLHAGFALCIIAGIIGIVAGVVVFMASKGD